MSSNLVILGRPPGRALFNVKSRTLRVLTTVFLLMESQCCRHGNSSHFFLSFFMEQEARTYTNAKTRHELRKRTYFGVLTYLPHTWSLQTSSVWSLSLLLQLFFLQSISRCCSRCSSHVRRCCLSIVLFDLPLEWLATKNTQRTNTSQNMPLLFIEREINK